MPITSRVASVLVRAGAALVLAGGAVNRYNSIKLYGSTGVYSRTGADFRAGGVAWQLRWGGGL